MTSDRYALITEKKARTTLWTTLIIAFIPCTYILITKGNFSPNFIYEYRVSLPNIPECFCVSTG